MWCDQNKPLSHRLTVIVIRSGLFEDRVKGLGSVTVVSAAFSVVGFSTKSCVPKSLLVVTIGFLSIEGAFVLPRR